MTRGQIDETEKSSKETDHKVSQLQDTLTGSQIGEMEKVTNLQETDQESDIGEENSSLLNPNDPWIIPESEAESEESEELEPLSHSAHDTPTSFLCKFLQQEVKCDKVIREKWFIFLDEWYLNFSEEEATALGNCCEMVEGIWISLHRHSVSYKWPSSPESEWQNIFKKFHHPELRYSLRNTKNIIDEGKNATVERFKEDIQAPKGNFREGMSIIKMSLNIPRSVLHQNELDSSNDQNVIDEIRNVISTCLAKCWPRTNKGIIVVLPYTWCRHSGIYAIFKAAVKVIAEIYEKMPEPCITYFEKTFTFLRKCPLLQKTIIDPKEFIANGKGILITDDILVEGYEWDTVVAFGGEKSTENGNKDTEKEEPFVWGLSATNFYLRAVSQLAVIEMNVQLGKMKYVWGVQVFYFPDFKNCSSFTGSSPLSRTQTLFKFPFCCLQNLKKASWTTMNGDRFHFTVKFHCKMRRQQVKIV